MPIRSLGPVTPDASPLGVAGELFEWSALVPEDQGRLRLQFFRPEGARPREFWLCPYLDHVMRDGSDAYLDRMFGFGRKVLCELEGTSRTKPALGEEHYRVARTLFRHRRDGRMWCGRRLMTGEDLRDRVSRESAVPGIVYDRVQPLVGGGPGRVPTHFEAVLAVAEETLAGTTEAVTPDAPPIRWPLPPELTDRDRIDLLFTAGAAPESRSRPWDGPRVATAVCRGLINGKYNPGAFEVSPGRLASVLHLRDRITEVHRVRSGREFDRWLKNARERRFLATLGHDRGTAVEREDAGAENLRAYGLLVWAAHELMARCYGALMLLVYGEFAVELELDLHEQWLFRQRHWPQAYLGGLPVCFLDRPHLRWVVRFLHANWYDSILDPEAYEVAAWLLLLFGETVGQLREGDRVTRRAGRPAGFRPDATTPDATVDEPVPELTSRRCRVCAEVYAVEACRSRPDGVTHVVTLSCRHCAREDDFATTLDQLENLYARFTADGEIDDRNA